MRSDEEQDWKENLMNNKTFLITGATNGIGAAMAEDLAQTGASIVIVSRNQAKCAAAADKLRRTSGNPNIRHYAADLSAQNEVGLLLEKLNQDLPRLDVLINNAGAWFTERQLSADSIEMTWALNHLNYFQLTHGLLDLLKRTAQEHGEARIINQASTAHHQGKFYWDNLQFDGNWTTEGKGSAGPGWNVYCQSKLANVTHALGLARRLKGTGVVANAIHPSVVVTGFSQNNGIIYKIAAPIRRLFNRTPANYGASPAIYLATADEASSINGTYYGPPAQQEEANPLAQDISLQDRLWAVSADQLGMAIA